MKRSWIIIATICSIAAVGLELYLMTTMKADGKAIEVYALQKKCEVGVVIEPSLLMKVSLPKESSGTQQYANWQQLIGKTTTRALEANKLLEISDFAENKVDDTLQTLVLKMNAEQSHNGQLSKGEVIDLLCYRQGAVQRVDGLIVESVASINSETADNQCYVTLKGPAKALETLFLTQQEGLLLIVKKTTVQMP